MNKKTALNRFKLGTPQRYVIAKKDNRMCAVLASIDTENNKCTSIESIIYPEFQNKK